MKEEAAWFLAKASRTLKVAEKLSEPDLAESAASRAYYAMFYTAEALLSEKNLSFRKHAGVHSAFGEFFVKTGIFDQKFHRWLLEAFNSRLASDYDMRETLSSEDAAIMIRQAREFLDAAQQYLSPI